MELENLLHSEPNATSFGSHGSSPPSARSPTHSAPYPHRTTQRPSTRVFAAGPDQYTPPATTGATAAAFRASGAFAAHGGGGPSYDTAASEKEWRDSAHRQHQHEQQQQHQQRYYTSARSVDVVQHRYDPSQPSSYPPSASYEPQYPSTSSSDYYATYTSGNSAPIPIPRQRVEFQPRDSYPSFSASYPPPSSFSSISGSYPYPPAPYQHPQAQTRAGRPTAAELAEGHSRSRSHGGEHYENEQAYSSSSLSQTYSSSLGPMLERQPTHHLKQSPSVVPPLATRPFPPAPSSDSSPSAADGGPNTYWTSSPSSLAISPASASPPPLPAHGFAPPPPGPATSSSSPAHSRSARSNNDNQDDTYQPSPSPPPSSSGDDDDDGDFGAYPPVARKKSRASVAGSGGASGGRRGGSGGGGSARPISPITGLPTKVLAKRLFPPRDAAKRRFYCPHQGCGKAFGRPSARETHLRSHNGARPFTCPIPSCGRPFSVFSNLKRHMIVHAGVDFRGITVHDLPHLEYDESQTPPLFFARQPQPAPALVTPSYASDRREEHYDEHEREGEGRWDEEMRGPSGAWEEERHDGNAAGQ
ncbi:hypothetical protein RQP46_000875 [Phenoliferia psychrophenolica]